MRLSVVRWSAVITTVCTLPSDYIIGGKQNNNSRQRDSLGIYHMAISGSEGGSSLIEQISLMD